jgi:hypothetical protein
MLIARLSQESDRKLQSVVCSLGENQTRILSSPEEKDTMKDAQIENKQVSTTAL